jgi:uncharacterized membrane protein
MHQPVQFRPPGRSTTATDRLTIASCWLMSAIALVAWLLVGGQLLSSGRFLREAGWPAAVLVLATAITTLMSLARQLPGQNVLLAATLIGLLGGIAHGLAAATAIPFGPINFTDEAGPKLLGLLPWPMPAIWIIVLLNSRGVARLILRPWRKGRTYGFWLMGITAALTVLFSMALDPYASQVRHYWLWQPTRLPLDWHGAPVANFLGWLVTTLLILAFATPALIDKQRRTRPLPPDYHPLVTWLLCLTLFTAGAAAKHLWVAAGFSLLTGTVVAVLAGFMQSKWTARASGVPPTASR